jgi:hypothetical protein
VRNVGPLWKCDDRDARGGAPAGIHDNSREAAFRWKANDSVGGHRCEEPPKSERHTACGTCVPYIEDARVAARLRTRKFEAVRLCHPSTTPLLDV